MVDFFFAARPFVFPPIPVLAVFLAGISFVIWQKWQRKKHIQMAIQLFKMSDSLVYKQQRINYKNRQTGPKKDYRIHYYWYNHAYLIANAHELVMIGRGAGYNGRLYGTVIFVKSRVPEYAPPEALVFFCSKITENGNDIEIVFTDPWRAPKPITLVIKNADEPLRKHLLEIFA